MRRVLRFRSVFGAGGEGQLPEEGSEVIWDPNTKTWSRRKTLKGDPGKNLSGMKSETDAELVDAAKRARDKVAKPETKPEMEDSDDMTEEQYKAKYGPLVGASKWKNRQKKTSSVVDSLGGPRA